MPIRILPDAELIVTTYLRAHADLPGGASTELPATPTYPWLTVARVGGVPSISNYLDVAKLEISAWAATKAAALALARGAEAALLALSGPQAGAVVTGVTQVGEGLRWNPDETSDVPRYQFVIEVYLYPA